MDPSFLSTAGYNSKRVSGITSTAATAVYHVAQGAMVKIFPSSAGTATVYSTGSPDTLAALDIATADGSDIVASTNASWDEWAAGAVTAKTIQQASMPQTALAVVVTSGTWVMEICA